MSRIRATGSLLAIALATVACGLLPAAPPLEPGSQYRVTAIDGEPIVGAELILTILGDSATLSSMCGASIGAIAANENGDLRFEDFSQPPPEAPCGEQALRAHRQAVEALGHVSGWQPVGNLTEFRGVHRMTLERQRTDT